MLYLKYINERKFIMKQLTALVLFTFIIGFSDVPQANAVKPHCGTCVQEFIDCNARCQKADNYFTCMKTIDCKSKLDSCYNDHCVKL